MTVQVTINTVSEVLQEAEIEVDGQELQPHFEKAYIKYQPKAELRGFRKGKVPMAMIRQLYGEAIEHDALDTIAGEFYQKVMEERNIEPVGQPALVDMNYQRGKHFRFKIKYEVKPTIEIKNYKGLAVEKPVHKVTDAEVEAELNHLRRINSTTAEVAAVTNREHIVTADVQELDDAGTPLIGKKTLDARFYLSDETLVKEIRDALLHAETGGTCRASFETKHDDHAHTNHLAIAVKKIERVDLPAFDDAFVKKITGEKVSSTEDFLKNLRTDLERYWEEQGERALADALATEVVKAHEFKVPDFLVESFLDSFLEDVKNRSKSKQLPKDFNEKKFREENRAYAIWQAKWLLLKERIAQAENIGVTDGEIEKLAETEAGRVGIDKERLVQYYRSSSAATDRLVSEKIMSLLKKNAKVTEKETRSDITA